MHFSAKCTAVMKRENVKFPFGQPFSSPTFITFLLIISSAAPTKTFGGADAFLTNSASPSTF